MKKDEKIEEVRRNLQEQRQGPNYIVWFISFSTEKADPEGGIDPSSGVSEHSEDLGERFSSLEGAIGTVADEWGLPKDPNEWSVNELEEGVIFTDQLVDERNIPASDRDIEQWRNGNKDLWNQTIRMKISEIVSNPVSVSQFTSVGVNRG